jgi:adenosylcobyric acid synthase
MGGDKTLSVASGRHNASGTALRGYEMHIGATVGPARDRPFMTFVDGRPDGAISADGKVAGCYLHGLFAGDEFRHAFLSGIRSRGVSGVAYEREIDTVLDDLADHLAAHLDLERILDVARGR